MSETLVRFEGAQELILEKLTALGIFKTRSEVIRTAILELGKDYGVFNSLQELEDELAARKMAKIHDEIKSGKQKVYSLEQVKKKYRFK